MEGCGLDSSDLEYIGLLYAGLYEYGNNTSGFIRDGDLLI